MVPGINLSILRAACGSEATRRGEAGMDKRADEYLNNSLPKFAARLGFITRGQTRERNFGL